MQESLNQFEKELRLRSGEHRKSSTAQAQSAIDVQIGRLQNEIDRILDAAKHVGIIASRIDRPHNKDNGYPNPPPTIAASLSDHIDLLRVAIDALVAETLRL